MVDRLALPEDLAAGLGEAAEQALHELAAAGADEAVEPDDLAAADPERNVLEALAGEVFPFRRISAPKGIVSLWWICSIERLIMPAMSFCLVGLGDALGGDQRAVAQDRDAVGELEDLFEAMAEI